MPSPATYVRLLLLSLTGIAASPAAVAAPAAEPPVLRADAAVPPRADQRSKQLVSPSGDRRVDEFYWLNERENPAVRTYLEAENTYADAVLAPVAALRDSLYRELRDRIQEDDSSVPFVQNGYRYSARFTAGQDYPVIIRERIAGDGGTQVVLDVNELARGHDYCALGSFEVSPDSRLVAYAVDLTGRGLFTRRIRDLETGRDLPDSFPTGDTFAWSHDSRTLLYDTKDAVTLRNDRIWRHTLGQPTSADVLVHHESDESQYAMLSTTRSGDYFVISSGYTQIVEVRVLETRRPEGAFRVIRPREPNFFYDVDHSGDQFFIRTNWNAPDFRLMTAPVSDPRPENWSEFLPAQPDVFLESVAAFAEHLVTVERRDGLSRLRITRLSDRTSHVLDTGEPTYSLVLDRNADFAASFVRYRFTSPRTPVTIVDYGLESRERTVRKVQPVRGGFTPDDYVTEFIWVTARDGEKVPVSLVFRRGTPRDGSAPCLLQGYGSYGLSYDASFDRDAISLLNRGFVIAIAHIRGGMERGFRWHDEGRMQRKMNTFNDFIDCAEFLIREGYTAPARLFITGRSAGGLLMGAVVNLRPDLFRGAIIGVPFVDVLTTMSDPNVPLTTSEYTEWGNPAKPDEYEYMKRYSPYDNLRAGRHPHLLVTTSFADSQVQYFEPAKYVARLRTLASADTIVLLRTNFAGSHGGSSGRFQPLEDQALEYAWMLALLGRTSDAAP